MRQIQATVDSSGGDVKSLLDKSEKLREIISYLKRNSSNPAQKSKKRCFEQFIKVL